MRRFLMIFLSGAVFGTAFGVAFGFFIYPFIFPPPPAMDRLTAEEQSQLLAQGEFLHANPSDPIHYGKGKVRVYEGLVYLDSDFEVGPGPKFHVYLVPKAEIRQSAEVENTMFVDLGPLRAFKGSQKYTIPAGVPLENYPSVVIWCAQFDVLISPADLTFEGAS